MTNKYETKLRHTTVKENTKTQKQKNKRKQKKEVSKPNSGKT